MNEAVFEATIKEVLGIMRIINDEAIDCFKSVAEALANHNKRLNDLEKMVYEMRLRELEILERRLRR